MSTIIPILDPGDGSGPIMVDRDLSHLADTARRLEGVAVAAASMLERAQAARNILCALLITWDAASDAEHRHSVETALLRLS